MSKNYPFEKMDREYEQDAAYLESICYKTPTNKEWEECMKVWHRTWDRLLNLSFIEGGTRNRN